MSSTHERLEALADRLEQGGEDATRVEIVRRAQRFKRSWVELAEGLCRLRDSRIYEDWGFGDLHEYCHRELAIKPSTADKLMLSFGTVQRHAPEVLERDGVSREIPSIEAVDYFTRALGDAAAGSANRRLDAPRDVIEQLRSAVFDEGRSVSELRQTFNPVLRPKPEGAEDREQLRRVRAAARRLSELVHQVPELSEARVARVDAVVEALVKDLDRLIADGAGQSSVAGTTAPAVPAAAMKKDASSARRPGAAKRAGKTSSKTSGKTSGKTSSKTSGKTPRPQSVPRKRVRAR